MDERSHFIPILKNKVSYVTLTIILRIYQGFQDAFPVLLETLTIPGKRSSRLITRNEIHSVVLGRENVARAPTEVTEEVLESLNEH